MAVNKLHERRPLSERSFSYPDRSQLIYSAVVLMIVLLMNIVTITNSKHSILVSAWTLNSCNNEKSNNILGRSSTSPSQSLYSTKKKILLESDELTTTTFPTMKDDFHHRSSTYDDNISLESRRNVLGHLARGTLMITGLSIQPQVTMAKQEEDTRLNEIESILVDTVPSGKSYSSFQTSSLSSSSSSSNMISMEPTTTKATKLTGLSDDEFGDKIRGDVVDRQFLVTANLSRELYDESVTFTDEIDTYQLDQWVKGTQRLFVSSKSNVELEPNSFHIDKSKVTFRFSEYLCFNIPLLQPIVYLSGQVVLKRDPDSGLITSYQEIWDQNVSSVLKTAKFFG